MIKQDPRPELEPAQAILSRLERRRLYVCLGESAFQRADRTASLSEDDIRDEISAIAGQLVDGSYREDDEGDGGEGAWGHGSPAESDEDEAGLGLGHGRSQGAALSEHPAAARAHAQLLQPVPNVQRVHPVHERSASGARVPERAHRRAHAHPLRAQG